MARMWMWLNRFVHEGMNHISNVNFHLKTRSGNVNIVVCLPDKVVYLTACHHDVTHFEKRRSSVIETTRTSITMVIIASLKSKATCKPRFASVDI